MYHKRNLVYVMTCLESIEKLHIYTQNIASPEDLLNTQHQMVYNACLTLLSVIGEETKKIDEEIKASFKNIPWKDIASMRNRIAHDYRGVNPNYTYIAITRYLEPLKSVLVKIYYDIDYPEPKKMELLTSRYYTNIQYLKIGS